MILSEPEIANHRAPRPGTTASPERVCVTLYYPLTHIPVSSWQIHYPRPGVKYLYQIWPVRVSREGNPRDPRSQWG